MADSDPLLAELEMLAQRAAVAEGVDIAWCELKGGSGARIFRVFIERKDGDVGLSDCERVSRRLSVILDVEDPIESSYTLEVSTPGLDRPLHVLGDYERFQGKLARVKTRQPVDGRKRFVARLAGVSGDVVRLDEDGRILEVPMSLIDSGRLELELGPPGRRRSRRSGKNA